MNPDGSFDENETKKYGDQIVQDMARMRFCPDRVVYNGTRSFAEQIKDPTLESITLESWKKDYGQPVSYFLHNAYLDSRLGITHIIRGKDRQAYDELYVECYRKLSCPAPWLFYVPTLMQKSGKV